MISILMLLSIVFLVGMAGTWSTSIQVREDSENPLGSTSSGTYEAGSKISAALSVTTGTNTGTITVPIVTIAKLQMIYLTCDQGTVSNPVTLTFTLSTGSLVVSLVAGQPYYWDVNQGIANPFAYSSTGTTAAYSIPTSALGLASGSTVNITGRIEQS